MNTASLEKSKELFDLSKEAWHVNFWFIWQCSHSYRRKDLRDKVTNEPVKILVNEKQPFVIAWDEFVRQNNYKEEDAELYEIYPAYDLGFLLRHLPPFSRIYKDKHGWYAIQGTSHEAYGESPEDAVAQLCITLIKEGVLPGKEAA